MMNTNKKTQNANASTTENNSSVFDKDEVFEFIDNGVREKNLDWDRKEVYKRLKKLAEKGDSYGQDLLGLLLSVGYGCEANPSEAFKWFTKAAEQGLANAQHALGLHYYHGCVVQKNYEKAAYWLEKAADQGHEDAEALLITVKFAQYFNSIS